MRRSWEVKTVAGSLLLAMLAMAGCSGGDDKKKEEEEKRRFQMSGSFFRISHYTDDTQALYLDAYVSAQARHGGVNLARWEKQGLNRSLPQGMLSKFKAPSGTGYLQAGGTYGAADPDVEVFFLVETKPGLTLYVRQSNRSEAVTAADLTGTYSCVRHLNQPSDELQWFQADFLQEGIVQYNLGGEDLEVSYKLEETGLFRIESDEGFSIDESEIGAKQERLFAGGFQKKQKFLMASYMIGDAEPDLYGSQPENQDGKIVEHEVETRGLLVCLQGSSRSTQESLQGEYWFNELIINPGQPDVNVFGYITADGAGSLHRTECRRSSGALREDTSTYEVNSEDYDGSLVLTEGKKKGVLSADGEVALLVSTDPTETSINILLKKYREGTCP